MLKSKQESQVHIDLHQIRLDQGSNILDRKRRGQGCQRGHDHGVQEGTELLGVKEEVGEALGVMMDEGVLEVLVVVMAVVVAVEEVVAVSKAHNTSNAQHLFSPTVFMRHHCCTVQANEKTEVLLHQELWFEGVDFLFGFFETGHSV